MSHKIQQLENIRKGVITIRDIPDHATFIRLVRQALGFSLFGPM